MIVHFKVQWSEKIKRGKRVFPPQHVTQVPIVVQPGEMKELNTVILNRIYKEQGKVLEVQIESVFVCNPI